MLDHDSFNEILCHLKPSDLFNLMLACKSHHKAIANHPVWTKWVESFCFDLYEGGTKVDIPLSIDQAEGDHSAFYAMLTQRKNKIHQLEYQRRQLTRQNNHQQSHRQQSANSRPNTISPTPVTFDLTPAISLSVDFIGGLFRKRINAHKLKKIDKSITKQVAGFR